MDLSTRYLGLPLRNPLMSGASPMVDDLGLVRRLEDSGVSAIVMHSLFEEQIAREREATLRSFEEHTECFAEASGFFPAPSEFRLGPEEYLEQIRRVKGAVDVPVIGSLNGVTPGGWLEYAKLIEQAGADALELNVYYIPTDPSESAEAVESRTVEIVREVRRQVDLPLAVKLSPFHSSLTHFAARLEEAGADGLVLFNRFYQPDIEVEALEVTPRLHLSDSSELLLRLRWLAILSARRDLDFAASGGVHTATDALKSIMAGAHAVQLVSALLRHGPEHLRALLRELREWMELHEYPSIQPMRGSMNHARCPDPSSFERGNYMRVLQSWRG